MNRESHLSEQELLDLIAAGHRPSPALKRHLLECVRCRGAAGDFRVLVRAVREGSFEPSPGVLSRVLEMVEPEPPRTAGGFRPARLIFDGAVRMAVGMRTVVEPRQQIWRAGPADIDLRFETAGLGSRARLMGQVLPRRGRTGSSGGFAWLWQAGRRRRWAVVGPGGDFVLPAPERRRWILLIEWGHLRLKVANP